MNIKNKIYAILISLLIVFLLSILYNPRLFEPITNYNEKVFEYSFTDVKKIFPEADSAQININGETIVYDEGKEIGIVINTSPSCNNYVAYAGRLPFIIGIDKEDKIKGTRLLKNYETPVYIRKLTIKKFFKRWDGLHYTEAIRKDVDIITGATLTTEVFIYSMQKRLALYANEGFETDKNFKTLFKYLSSGIVILFALVSFLFPSYFKKYRWILLVASIGVIGIWQGVFLSMQLFITWISTGIRIPAQIMLFILFVFAIVLPLFTNKSFYCHYVCPYGAAQELAGKIVKKKFRIKGLLAKILKYARKFYLVIIIGLLVFQIVADVSNLEPFNAFQIQMASVSILILAGFFLLLSVIITKPWCNYFCPTGVILEQLRRPFKIKNKKLKHILAISGIVLLIALILYFYFMK